MDLSGLKLGQVTGINKPKLVRKNACSFFWTYEEYLQTFSNWKIYNIFNCDNVVK